MCNASLLEGCAMHAKTGLAVEIHGFQLCVQVDAPELAERAETYVRPTGTDKSH